MTVFQPKWRNWAPETPIQRTDSTDKSPSVSFVSASHRRFHGKTGDTGSAPNHPDIEENSHKTRYPRTDKADRSPDTVIPATDDAQEAFEERAAILEFDGEYSREEAERIAHEEQAIPLVPPIHHAPFGARADPADWPAWFTGRVRRQRSFGCGPEDAHARAYGEAVEAWAAQHWDVPSSDSCAACGTPEPAFQVPDGAWVCRQSHWQCLISYGQSRKAQAAASLAEIGITPADQP